MFFIVHREYFTNSHIIIYLFLYFITSLIFNPQFVLHYFIHIIMSSVTQEDGFTEVTRDRKKRKASGSPTRPSQPKPGSSEPSLGTPVRPKPSIKNSIPVILSGFDGKFKNWRSVLGELRQYHPLLKVS